MKTGDARGSVRTWLVVAAIGAAAVALIAVIVMVVRAPRIMMQPVYRLVDAQWRAHDAAPAGGTDDRTTTRLPGGTLGNETRYVLQPNPHGTIVYDPNGKVLPSGRATYYPLIPAALGDAERMVLLPRIEAGSRRVTLPTSVVTAERHGDQRKARVEFVVPPELAGTPLMIYVEAYAISGSTAAYRTPEVEIPKQAFVAFGIGIEEAAWSQGPVVFSIKTCVADHCDPLFSQTLDARKPEGRGWHDRTASLELLGQQKRSLLFEARLVNDAPDAFSFVLWSNPTVYAPRPRLRDQTNVILLSLDTLSAKHLRTYGYEHDTDPFIEETFGKHGTVFERCVAPATTTGPSHMSLFTSVAPNVHRVGTTTGTELLPSWLVTMAEAFRDAGFETGAVTEDGWIAYANGFGRGFNSYAENDSPDVWEPSGQVLLTFGAAKRWLTLNRDKRFFLFLHTYQVHKPYVPPPAYAGLFATHDGKAVTADSPGYLRDVVGYDGEIRYCDDELRLLFQTIKELSLDSNTIFVLMSDHGEEFLEHGYLEHGAQLYDEVTRVPLMFWGPGHIPEGRRLQAPVSLVDVMPTLLQMMSVDIPPQATGVSLADPLLGRGEELHRPLFSEAWAPYAKREDEEPQRVLPPAYLLQVGLRKLMAYRRETGLQYEYYDLSNDPQELTNLWDKKTGELEGLQAQLDSYEAECKAVAATLARASQQGGVPTPGRAALSPDQKEKLRALGYVQ